MPKTLRRILFTGLFLMILTAMPSSAAEPTPVDTAVWKWGWGTYGGVGSALDTARYDWSVIRFGNTAVDQSTVDRCNKILAINPRHKFMIRVWPHQQIGANKENKHQATFLEYHYDPTVREKMNQQIHRQVRLILDGIDQPENVVGLSFAEELPWHFSAVPIKYWRKNADYPWDIQQYDKQVAAELGGEQFDPANFEHRLWWGRTYTAVLADIHREMKAASGGLPVFYWQATAYWTLDHAENDKQRLQANYLPFTYADILKDGLCDGIFGYPNNQHVWERQTVATAKAYDCLFFSQLSTPSGMRLATWDDMLQMSRVDLPGNMGVMVYSMASRGRRVWNEMPFMDGSRYWTVQDISRRIGWEQQIGMDVIDRQLGADVSLVYDFTGKGEGDFVRVFAQVTNTRHASWYGGDAKRATLQNLRISLDVPEGLSIPRTNNGLNPLPLGDLAGGDTIAGEWWVLVDSAEALPLRGAIRTTVEADAMPPRSTASSELAATVPGRQVQMVNRADYRWVEPNYQPKSAPSCVVIEPLLGDIFFPAITIGGERAEYRDTVAMGTRLVLGPGYRATLQAQSMLTPEQQLLDRENADDEPVCFDSDYIFHRLDKIRVEPGQDYRVTVDGKVQGGANLMVIAHFDGALESARGRDQKLFIGSLRARRQRRSVTITAPEADGKKPLFLSLRFYRLKEKGTVCLNQIDLQRADIPDEGADVTPKLDGRIPSLKGPFVICDYSDRSDPDRWARPTVNVQFAMPEDVLTASTDSGHDSTTEAIAAGE